MLLIGSRLSTVGLFGFIKLLSCLNKIIVFANKCHECGSAVYVDCSGVWIFAKFYLSARDKLSPTIKYLKKQLLSQRENGDEQF